MSVARKSQAYAIATLASLLILLLRSALSSTLGEVALLLPFVSAVILAAWWGGLGPGLLATLLSALSGVFFFAAPHLSLWGDAIAHGLNAVFFVVNGVAISVLFESLHAARRAEAERQFRRLADTIPQLVWMARPDGSRTWFNARWYEYTGLEPAQCLGWGWQRVHDPAEIPRVLKSWQATVKSGQPWEETYPLRRHDGHMRWHLARAMPVKDSCGNITSWFGTSTDISDRIQTERALKDADRRKDEFLATLAHELRNPLAPLSYSLQLWPLVANDPAKLDSLRQVMSRQVQQLTRLTDDLLDVSRVTYGKVTLQLEPVDLRDSIARAVETVKPLLDECRHELTVSLPESPAIVSGDATRLTQVFSNMLNNAAKYTGSEGKIAVSLQTVGNSARVSIRDNGPGIPPEKLNDIFQVFQQVDTTLTRAHGGLGIGLTLVKQLVTLHRGTVIAHSDGLGKGAEFIVELPLHARQAAVVVSPDVVKSPSESTHLPKRRIVIVDDARDSAETLASYLGSLGQEVHVFEEGAKAIDWIVQNEPDIAFVDISMPGMDGCEVARHLRQQASLPRLLLVALTGFGQDADRRRTMEAGFDVHLTKPATAEGLRRLLSAPLPFHEVAAPCAAS